MFKMIFVNAGLALALVHLAVAVSNVERRTGSPKYNVLVTDKVSTEARDVRRPC